MRQNYKIKVIRLIPYHGVVLPVLCTMIFNTKPTIYWTTRLQKFVLFFFCKFYILLLQFCHALVSTQVLKLSVYITKGPKILGKLDSGIIIIYSQTWNNDCLRIAATCLQCPSFWSPILSFYNMNNDHLVSISWTFYACVFLYKIFGAKISNPKASLV